VRLTASHLAVVGLLVLGGLALTLWWVLRADRGDSVVPPVAAPLSAAPLSGGPGRTSVPPSGTAGSGSPGAASAAGPASGSTPAAGQTPSAAATGRIVVDVAGKVRRPGIATLPAGSRVVDALAAAGGPRRGVHTGSLNLARVLTDGEQIVVGLPAPRGVAASAASAPTSGAGTPLVNINTATEAELEELPGVGPVTAQSILDFRTENGTFTAVDELLEISGIGDATLAKIAPYVTL
jgi:competence protein ComEA